MLAHTLPIASLMSGVALLLVGNGLLGTLLAVRGNEAGFSDAFLGLLGSGYFAGYLIGSFLAPPLIQRVGHIRAFAFFAAGLAGTALAHGLLVSPTTWVALRVLAGAAIVALYTLIESWLNDQTPQAMRARIFAIYMMVHQLSLALAQQILHFDSGNSPILFMAAALFVCLAVMPVTATRLKQPAARKAGSFSLLRVSLAEGATVEDAIRLSGVLEAFPEIDLGKNKVGIFSKLVKLDEAVRDKDRVEIYRPLIADPKEVRRKRAEEGKVTRKGGGDAAPE